MGSMGSRGSRDELSVFVPVFALPSFVLLELLLGVNGGEAKRVVVEDSRSYCIGVVVGRLSARDVNVNVVRQELGQELEGPPPSNT